MTTVSCYMLGTDDLGLKELGVRNAGQTPRRLEALDLMPMRRAPMFVSEPRHAGGCLVTLVSSIEAGCLRRRRKAAHDDDS